MRILFDQGTPVPLRALLPGHVVATVYELGWSQLRNGELIRQAELAGYDAFVTTDQSLRYQQQLDGRSMAIVVLMAASWPRIRQHADHITTCFSDLQPGAYLEIPIP